MATNLLREREQSSTAPRPIGTARKTRVAPGRGLPVRLWLRLSGVTAALGIGGSIAGIVFEGSIYGREKAEWAAQSIGQDIANLVAFAALAVAAVLTARGSIRAYLVWTGLLVYSAYTYAIYVFAVHFGPLFLVWVTIFGLSIYTLIAALTRIDPEDLRVRSARLSDRFAGRLLVAIAAFFGLAWLSEIVPAVVTGAVPASTEDAGLLTNPVHVLDLSLLLPCLMAAGILLLRDHSWGYVLAPTLLVTTIFLGFGIISLTLVSAFRGLDVVLGVGVGVAVLVALEALALVRFLRSLQDAPRLSR